MSNPTIPASTPEDPSAVASALDVARELWENGSHTEAVRWLKRAVEAAADAGHDVRSDMLMKAVIELERSSEEPALTPPPAPPPVTDVKPPPVPSLITPAASKPPPPLPLAARRSPTHPPAAPASMPPTRAQSASPATSTREPQGYVPPPSPPISTAPSHLPPPSLPVGGAHATVEGEPSAAPHALGSRIRVSVKTSARDPNLLVVRPLPEGKRPPPGTREGTLLLVDDSSDGRNLTNGSPAA
jgi:hypothetical protein